MIWKDAQLVAEVPSKYIVTGETYRGVNIGGYVGIIRGPYKIVGRIEKEYLQDTLKKKSNQTYELDRFERHIEVTVIGCFVGKKFEFGIKALPLIFNEAILLLESEISFIVSSGLNRRHDGSFIDIGKSVQESAPVQIPINGLFNTHIGIFGNTGSGKSNTLAKLYSEIFNHKILDPTKNSQFVILDFNGEYTGESVFLSKEHKKVIELSTRGDAGDRIPISPQNFWDKETLSILFSATEKTQQPFIGRVLDFYLGDEVKISQQIVGRAVRNAFKDTFAQNQHKDTLSLLKKIYDLLGIDPNKTGEYNGKSIPLYSWQWHSSGGKYYGQSAQGTEYGPVDLTPYAKELDALLDESKCCDVATEMDGLQILIYAQLIHGLRYNHIQYEHINPLLSRVEMMKPLINRTIEIADTTERKALTIISLKNCNQDAKKSYLYYYHDNYILLILKKVIQQVALGGHVT